MDLELTTEVIDHAIFYVLGVDDPKDVGRLAYRVMMELGDIFPGRTGIKEMVESRLLERIKEIYHHAPPTTHQSSNG